MDSTRITNPIESAFATGRPRTKVTKGGGCAAAALAMVLKLIGSAQQRWRDVMAPHLVERREVVAATGPPAAGQGPAAQD
ncbi:hypothetical protein [Streptomyces sp. LARHCF252]